MDNHLDIWTFGHDVLSVYSGEGVRFDALGVTIRCYNRCYNYPITDGQHESHGRPFRDAELLEQLRTGMIERVFNPIARLENIQHFTVSYT